MIAGKQYNMYYARVGTNAPSLGGTLQKKGTAAINNIVNIVCYCNIGCCLFWLTVAVMYDL